jgi:hypothetical protein
MVGLDGDHSLKVALGRREIMLGLQNAGAQNPEWYRRFRLAPPWRQRALGIADETRIGLGNADAELARGEIERKVGVARMACQCGCRLADCLKARIGAGQNALEHLIVVGRDKWRGIGLTAGRTGGREKGKREDFRLDLNDRLLRSRSQALRPA